MGKSDEEFLRAVGKPDSTSETSWITYWDYSHKTIDPITGNTDHTTTVGLKRDKHGTLRVVSVEISD
jgi:hypothetical protein